MTETSEQAAAHKLSETHMRLLVATTEGYQPLLEEKTEFPVSPCSRAPIPKPPRSPRHRQAEPQSAAVPSQQTLPSDGIEMEPETMEDKSLTDYMARGHSSTLLNSCSGKRPSSGAGGGKHHKKGGYDPNSGKFNTFTARDSRRRGHFDVERTSFCEMIQKRQPLPEEGLMTSQRHSMLSIPHLDRTPSNESREDGSGADSVNVTDHQPSTPLPSPSKKPHEPCPVDYGGDEQQHVQPVARPGVARLCEYHLAKRISTLQNEHSLQSSQCSSLDAGCSTGSSACATPTDSPLAAAAPDGRHLLSESSSSLVHCLQGQLPSNMHPHADPALLRKMLPNIHPAPGSDPALSVPREGTARSSKIKETTGTARRSNLFSDLHAKPGSVRNLNTKEGSEAYRQLINYLTVSQMHQGGKLQSAGLGGGRKDRRHLVNSPQLLDLVRGKGNTIARCPCMPPPPSPFLSPHLAQPGLAPSQGTRGPRLYHSATLPAKLKRSPDLHAQRPATSLEVSHGGHHERRSSFSGLEGDLERGVNPERLLSLAQRDGVREGGPCRSSSSRSRGGGADDWFRSDWRTKHVVHQAHNDSLCFSATPSVARSEQLATGAGDQPALYPRQVKACASPAPPPPPSPPPPPPPPPHTTTTLPHASTPH